MRDGHDDVAIRPALWQHFDHEAHPRLVLDRNALRTYQSTCLFDNLKNRLHRQPLLKALLCRPFVTLLIRCFPCAERENRFVIHLV
jgi:hypothetical protein